MEYLEQCNRRNYGTKMDPSIEINPEGKNVLVIGGGDTGSDCVGIAPGLVRKQIVQNRIAFAKPPVDRSERNPWPNGQ